MAAAAKLTEARVNAEEGNGDPKGGEATAGRAVSSASTPQNSRNGTDCSAATATGVGAERKPGGGSRQGGVGGHAEDAKSEFARVAQTLRQESGNTGVGGKQPAAMDVDSDEEEETVTLEGEFKSAEGAPRASTGVGGAAAAGNKDGPEDMDNDDDDDDLLSAVKKGKGRGRGKGKAKGKRGKA